MTATIKIKNSSTASAVPGSGDLVQGELAVNVTDKKIYTKNASGTIVNLGTTPSITDNGNAEAIVIDSSENVGIGVSPSAWSASFRSVQVGATGAVTGRTGTTESVTLSSNYVNNAGAKYIVNGFATQFDQYDGKFIWNTAGSGTAGNAITFTQAMTLDASGNLGLGTSSPDSSAGYAFMTTNGSSGSGFHAQSGGITVSKIEGVSGSTNITAEGSRNIQFYTNSSERARIDSSGNLLVGTTQAGQADGTYFQFRSGFTAVSHASGTPSGDLYSYFTYGGAGIGTITQNGTTGVSYNTSSDYRLKNTIAPMTGALAKVAALKPCTYKWNADGSAGEGFIAHELAEVVPQCVTGEKDAVDADGNPVYQGIDTSFLVATLTAAIQELKAEFDAYKATHP